MNTRLAPAILAAVASPALAQGVRETVTFNPANSNGILNDPSNTVVTTPFVGGYSLGKINYSGTLTALNTHTWATDARIVVTAPGGASVTLQPFTTTGTFTTANIAAGTFFYLNPGVDPAGVWTFRFYEVADDGGPASIDARWNITFQMTDALPAAPTATDLGTLVAPGPSQAAVNLTASQVLWYKLTLPWPVHPVLGTYLDIDTFGTSFAPVTGQGSNDTQIALFDSSGVLVGTDDDNGPGFTSQLSFGAGTRPARPDGVPYDGRNGALNAGTYYLALAAFRLQPQPLYWGVSPASPLTGTIAYTIRTNLSAASLPCYGNCDASTTAPVLNTADFTCFLQKYATGVTLPAAQQQTHYANCDGSTIFPQVNTGDFTCFLQKYAAGCS